MAHCPGRGDEILVGDKAHMTLFEQGGIAQVSSVNCMYSCSLSGVVGRLLITDTT